MNGLQKLTTVTVELVEGGCYLTTVVSESPSSRTSYGYPSSMFNQTKDSPEYGSRLLLY